MINLAESPAEQAISAAPKKLNEPLTPKQEKFAQYIVAGRTSREAYEFSGYSMRGSDRTVTVKASDILGDPKVQQRIQELRNKVVKRILLSLSDRLGILAEIANDETAWKSDRIKAIDVYTKIAGDGAPQLRDDGDGGTRIYINLFKDAPSRVHALDLIHEPREVAPITNGNGHHD